MADLNTNKESYEDLRLEKKVDEKIKQALEEYDRALWDKIRNYVTIALTKFESAYGVGKFVVVAVALLVIGTLYQIFVTLAQTGVGK
ncbi:hypothetical protein F6X56_15230 [Rhodococcus erythropolis]|uniref:hypothetical protein n=1 Tax=Rhodococcus erythropolis TaxID=1833 RepID=UPI0005A2F617|nr:hypothetical protein [Rhodococcus erythropolis]QEX10975.1 hypothetical protein F6X56_15230 [Rhodococcus erythropolis]